MTPAPLRPFGMRVCPVFRLWGCATMRAEQAQGLFGFHAFTRCPACRVEAECVELWGENGHCQGRLDPTADLGDALEHRRAFEASGGYGRTPVAVTFTAGGALYYAAGWLEQPGPRYGIPDAAEEPDAG